MKSDKQAEQASVEAKSDETAVSTRESALSATPADLDNRSEQRKDASAGGTVADACTVIKDGGAYEKPGTITNYGLDDEEFTGTHCIVITDPEANEHEHLNDVVQVQSEQHARDFSAQRKYRSLYFCWLTDDAAEEQG